MTSSSFKLQSYKQIPSISVDDFLSTNSLLIIVDYLKQLATKL